LVEGSWKKCPLYTKFKSDCEKTKKQNIREEEQQQQVEKWIQERVSCRC